MRAAGYRPCVTSYTAALKPPCAVGDLHSAATLLAEMELDFAAEGQAAAARGGRAAAGGDACTARGGDAFTPRGKKKKRKRAEIQAAGGASPGRDLAPTGGDFAPNVRTANTYLRGCLVAGGVGEAWRLYARLGRTGARLIIGAGEG
jgi:hypothetical protein